MSDFRALLRGTEIEPPLDDSTIDDVLSKFPINVPSEYRDFMRHANGAMGDVGSGWILLHSLEGISAPGEDDPLPGRVVIGYDGGSFYYAMRDGDPPQFVEISIEDFEERDLGPTMVDLLCNRTVI